MVETLDRSMHGAAEDGLAKLQANGKTVVLPNAALACSLAKSDSKSDLAVFRCFVHRSIQ